MSFSSDLKISAPAWYIQVHFVMRKDDVMIKAVAKWHEQVVGSKPFIGASLRLGFASDAKLAAHGVECVNYSENSSRS